MSFAAIAKNSIVLENVSVELFKSLIAAKKLIGKASRGSGPVLFLSALLLCTLPARSSTVTAIYNI